MQFVIAILRLNVVCFLGSALYFSVTFCIHTWGMPLTKIQAINNLIQDNI